MSENQQTNIMSGKNIQGDYAFRVHSYGTGGRGENDKFPSIGHLSIELVNPDGTSKHFGFYPNVEGKSTLEQINESYRGTKGIIYDDKEKKLVSRITGSPSLFRSLPSRREKWMSIWRRFEKNPANIL